jgi:hypothetical protein
MILREKELKKTAKIFEGVGLGGDWQNRACQSSKNHC